MALTVEQVHGPAIKVAQSAVIYPAEPLSLARVGTVIAYIESRFNPSAKNPKSTASGLMQVTKATQADVEKALRLPIDTRRAKIWDPNYALMIGLNRLAYQYKRYKDWNKAIVAYNQGSYNNRAAGKAYLSTWLKAYKLFNFPSIEANL